MGEEEEERSWFARWEDELPTPEELMPLSQSLITPDLALAFDIPTPTSSSNPNPSPPSSFHHLHPPPPPTHQPPEYDSGDMGGCGDGGGGPDEPARTLKRPRLVWTPQLHKRFVDAVAHLGIKNAVPKTIMQLMSVEGLTRENVASHLQKYRLYLKRMQGLGSSSGGGGHISAADDQLFASGPVPHQFLNRGPGPGAPEPFIPYVPAAAAALQHHQQMAAAAAVQQQYYHQRQMGHFGSPTGSGLGFEHGFLARSQPQQPGIQRIVGTAGMGMIHPPSQPQMSAYAEDHDSGTAGRRRVLTLFPTGED